MKRKRAHETKEIGHDSKTEPLHLSDLQRDLHCVVFSYASLEDRLAIRLVCKSWHQWSSLQLSWAPNLSLGDKYLPAKKLRSLATSLRGKRFTQVEFNLVPKQYRLLLEKICGNLKTLELTIVHVDGSLRLLNSLRHRDEIKSLSLYTSLTGNENPYLEMKSLTDLRAWMFFQSDVNHLSAARCPLQRLWCSVDEHVSIASLNRLVTLQSIHYRMRSRDERSSTQLIQLCAALPSLPLLTDLTIDRRGNEHLDLTVDPAFTTCFEHLRDSQLHTLTLRILTCDLLTEEQLSILAASSTLTEFNLEYDEVSGDSEETLDGSFLSIFAESNRLRKLMVLLSPDTFVVDEEREMRVAPYNKGENPYAYDRANTHFAPALYSHALSIVCQLTNLTHLQLWLDVESTTRLDALSALTKLQILKMDLYEDAEAYTMAPTWLRSLPVSLLELSLAFPIDTGFLVRPPTMSHKTFAMCFTNMTSLTKLTSLWFSLDGFFEPEDLKLIAHLPLQKVQIAMTTDATRKMHSPFEAAELSPALSRCRDILKGVDFVLRHYRDEVRPRKERATDKVCDYEE